MGTQKKIILSIEFESLVSTQNSPKISYSTQTQTQNSSKMSHSTQNPGSKIIENETQTHFFLSSHVRFFYFGYVLAEI
jgi:hypothetical protein